MAGEASVPAKVNVGEFATVGSVTTGAVVAGTETVGAASLPAAAIVGVLAAVSLSAETKVNVGLAVVATWLAVSISSVVAAGALVATVMGSTNTNFGDVGSVSVGCDSGVDVGVAVGVDRAIPLSRVFAMPLASSLTFCGAGAALTRTAQRTTGAIKDRIMTKRTNGRGTNTTIEGDEKERTTATSAANVRVRPPQCEDKVVNERMLEEVLRMCRAGRTCIARQVPGTPIPQKPSIVRHQNRSTPLQTHHRGRDSTD
jgi:hypothetical protein